MRDLDRVKEKIEIRLEPRQVIQLAVVTMLFSGALFAAGFLIGRGQAGPPVRVAADDLAQLDAEARAPRDGPTAPRTPVAMGEVEFLFPSVLGSRPGRRAKKKPEGPSKAALRAKRRAAEAKRRAKREAAARKEAERKAAEAKAVEAEAAARLEAELAAAEAARAVEEEAARAAAEAAERLVAEEAEEAAKAAAALAVVEDEPKVKPAPAPEPKRPDASSNTRPRRFTLQVKASRDRDDAERFVASLRKAGFEPHLVLADVPGKGRYYRVRLGRFDSIELARAFQRRYKAKSGRADGGFITDL